jgi:hypothetical protein
LRNGIIITTIIIIMRTTIMRSNASGQHTPAVFFL